MRSYLRYIGFIRKSVIIILLLGVLGILGQSLSGPAVATAAVTSALPGPIVHTAAGAGGGGEHATTVNDQGQVVDYINYAADPLAMPASIDEGVIKMVNETNPDANGECAVAGFSLGSIVARSALPQLATKCKHVTAYLSGSPNGPGSVNSFIPDNPLIKFAHGPVPANATVYSTNLRNDGFPSCPGIQAVIQCTAGAIVGHYGAVDNIYPGQSYATFNGKWSEYEVNGQHYKTGETKNPVGVLIAAGIRSAGIKDFDFNDRDFRIFEMMFPQGTPGIDQPGLNMGNIDMPEMPSISPTNAVGTVGDNPVADVIASVTGGGSAQNIVSDVIKAVAPQVAPAAQNNAPMNDVVTNVVQSAPVQQMLDSAPQVKQIVEQFIPPVQSAPAYTAPVASAPVMDLAPMVTNTVNDIATNVAAANPAVAPMVNDIAAQVNTGIANFFGGLPH